MNHLEFNLGLSNLEANLTTEDRVVAYTPEQKDLMWEEFRTLNISTWNDLIAELRRRYSFLPKTSHFYNVLKEAESEEGGGIARDIRRIEEGCSLCGGIGLRWGIFRREIIYKGEKGEDRRFRTAVAKCSCRNSENWSRKIPTKEAVEANKGSGLVEFAPAGRLGVAMEALSGQAQTAPEVKAELPDDSIPF